MHFTIALPVINEQICAIKLTNMLKSLIMKNEMIEPANEVNLAGKKILFASVPADGHFNPLTGLAVYMKELGADVRWYTANEYGVKLARLGIQHYPFRQAREITAGNMETTMPERNKIKNPIRKLNYDIINVFILRGVEYYQDIKSIYREFAFDVMVADCAFTGIPFVKDKMNIPVVAIGVFPLSQTSRDLAPSGLGITPSDTVFGRYRQAVLRFAAKHILFRESNKVMRKVFGEHGITHNNEIVFDIIAAKSDLLLQSGTPGFEYYRSDLRNNVRFIGALLPYSKNKKQTQWFDERLNQYNRVVLVTQGTVEKDIEKILVPALEAFRNTDTLVVATTGGSQTGLLRERYADRNFIIEDFIPFEDVMPYADVYVSNGGYGGVMLSIENKLPMVVAGVHEGKNEINARIGYFDLGINLKTETPKAAEIRSAVETIMSNAVYWQKINQLSKEFSNYNANKLAAGYTAGLLQQKLKLITRKTESYGTV
jgi:MGT family glycosyltransferase